MKIRCCLPFVAAALLSAAPLLAAEIHTAAYDGDLSRLRGLLATNAALVNAKTTNGSTPLHYAARAGRREALTMLLDAGADLKALDSQKHTPLHCAAHHGQTGVVALLIERGADFRASDDDGCTPLHLAVLSGEPKLVELLLDKGVPVTERAGKDGLGPLFFASYPDSSAVVEVLLRAGAKVGQKDNTGATALHFASFRGATNVIRSLLRAGAEVQATDQGGLTPLHAAAQGGHVAAAALLVEAGDDVNAHAADGPTPLHTAAREGQLEMVRWLMAHQANPSLRDRAGKRPLDYASGDSATRIIAALAGREPAPAGPTPTDTLAAAVPDPQNHPRVGSLGQLSRIRFAGQQAYSEAALRRSLRYQLDLLLALEADAPLEGCLRTLEKLLQSGYQHAGFADVAVRATVDDATNHLVVHIQEGPRLFCGQAQVLGLKTLAATNLLARLETRVSESAHATATNASRPDLSATKAVQASELKRQLLATPPMAMTLVTNSGQVPELDPGLWEPGSPAMLDSRAQRRFDDAVTSAFKDLGHFYPRFTVKQVRRPAETLSPVLKDLAYSTNREVAAWFAADRARAEGRLLDLVIEVADEGPACTIGQFEILGAQTNSTEDVLRFLEAKPGQRLTQTWVDEAERKLEDSGRFLQASIEENQPEPDGRVTLTLRLAELPEAPPLSQPLAPETQALLRLRQWFLGWQTRGDDLVLRLRGYTTARPAGIPAEFIASPAGGLLLRLGATNPAAGTNAQSFGVSARRGLAGAYYNALARKLVSTNFQGGLSAFWKIKAGPGTEESGRFNMEIGAGFSSDKDQTPFAATLELPPVAFVYLAHKGDLQWRIDGPQLTGSSSNLTLRSEAATGRLLAVGGHNEFAADQVAGLDALNWSLGFEAGAFARAEAALARSTATLTNAYDVAQPISSAAGYLAELLLHSPAPRALLPASLLTNLAPERLQPAGRALEKLVGADLFKPLEPIFAGGTNAEEDILTIPLTDADAAAAANPLTYVAAMVLAHSRELVPHESWLETLARLIALRLVNEADRVEPEFARLTSGGQFGPVGYLALSGNVGPEGARQLALKGLIEANAEGFVRDCRVLLDEEVVLGQILANLARAVGRLEETDLTALAALLSAPDADFLRRTAALMRQPPAQPVADVLQPALEQWWRAGMKARVQAELRQRSRPASR